MPKGDGRVKSVAFSVRLTVEEHEALLAIALSIGNGATATGVILQAIQDRIAAERTRV